MSPTQSRFHEVKAGELPLGGKARSAKGVL